MDIVSECYPFYAPASIDQGHIVLPVSVCLSVSQLKTLPVNVTLSYNFHSIQVIKVIFSMQEAVDNTN